MDVQDVDTGEKHQTLEAVMEGDRLFRCNKCDSEIVNKMAEILLPGLATACIDNTTGGLFKSPEMVAVDLRKELVAYLTVRSETFVAELVIQEDNPDAETSDHPTDILEDFIEDFASSKRNLFSRVSGWLLSEKREDKVDDFAQQMESSGFWLMDRRVAIAETLLKNVDFKNVYHCEKKFDTDEELTEHQNECIFRSLMCTNDGCDASFCAVHMEKHNSTCPFKVLPCEQKCPESIVRREMDRHCITVCPMKLVNDYTLFDHRSTAENPLELMRPYLHEFLSAVYAEYDIIIWSATSMKWVELKMGQLGVLDNPNYKITALLDHLAMITVQSDTHRTFDCKPLGLIWAQYPEYYNSKNTIMFDDLRRNFVMNPQNGLTIRPFRKAHLNRSKDKELVRLTEYLLAIAELSDLSSLDHSRWEAFSEDNVKRPRHR